MKFFVASIALLSALFVAPSQDNAPRGQIQTASPIRPPGLVLASRAFADGDTIPLKYTAANPMPISPPLEWTNVPPDTVSFVLIAYDPDVVRQRSESEVLHWLVIGIPGGARALAEGVPSEPSLEDGTVQGINDQKRPGYLGPGAPAAGPPHHYMFVLFALNAKLPLGPLATRAEVQTAMSGHVLAKAVLVGRFMRPPRPV